MQNTASYLNDIHAKLAPSAGTLSAARSRREEVLAAARSYPGALRTYKSGSIAHRTANHDTDADCGVVLDRRSYPSLGPDGDGEAPNRIVEDVREFLRERLKEDHPDIRFRVTKRAIQVSFSEPLDDGTDPSVDLIVALTRRDEEGLWIPNNETRDWDASHPEHHTKVLTDDPAGLRRIRARVIRLAKGWNTQFTQPGLCSFNIEALALSAVAEEHDVPDGLAELFRFAASDLKRRLTPDPAGVSRPIKLLMDRDVVVGRLERAARRMSDALDNDDDKDKVQEAMAGLYPEYISPPVGSTSKEAIASALRSGSPTLAVSGGVLSVGGSGGPGLKATRSWGRGSGLRKFTGPPNRNKVPWYGLMVARCNFERGVKTQFPNLRDGRIKDGYEYVATVPVPGYDPRKTRIRFSGGANIPSVFADGPGESPHRFDDDGLCIWHPDDPVEHRWVFGDGLVALMGLVMVHLFKEAWWRETGEWLGEEVPHGAQPKKRTGA